MVRRRRYAAKEILSKWQISEIPFVPILPEERSDMRSRVITGRDEELEHLGILVEQARAIFVNGLFGCGKTLLCLELLSRLPRKRFAPIYATYLPERGFIGSVLFGLAEQLRNEKDREGELLWQILKNGSITRTEVLEAGIEVGFWQFLKGKVKASEKEEVKVDIEDPLAWLMDILGRLRRDGRHPVIVFEDYDKQLDPREQPYDITMRVRDLINRGCTVIITGHPVGLTSAFDPKFDSSADILQSFPLKPLSAAQLLEMCRKYLAFVRTVEKPRSRTYPFTKKAVDSLASWVSGLRLTPRIFNNLCSDILNMAIRNSVIQINDKAVDNLLQESGKERIEALRQEDKDYLREVYKRGGIITEDYRDIIEAISGPEFGTYIDALTRVQPLRENEIIVPLFSTKRDLELQIEPRYEAIFLSEEADYHI